MRGHVCCRVGWRRLRGGGWWVTCRWCCVAGSACRGSTVDGLASREVNFQQLPAQLQGHALAVANDGLCLLQCGHLHQHSARLPHHHGQCHTPELPKVRLHICLSNMVCQALHVQHFLRAGRGRWRGSLLCMPAELRTHSWCIGLRAVRGSGARLGIWRWSWCRCICLQNVLGCAACFAVRCSLQAAATLTWLDCSAPPAPPAYAMPTRSGVTQAAKQAPGKVGALGLCTHFELGCAGAGQAHHRRAHLPPAPPHGPQRDAAVVFTLHTENRTHESGCHTRHTLRPEHSPQPRPPLARYFRCWPPQSAGHPAAAACARWSAQPSVRPSACAWR